MATPQSILFAGGSKGDACRRSSWSPHRSLSKAVIADEGDLSQQCPLLSVPVDANELDPDLVVSLPVAPKTIVWDARCKGYLPRSWRLAKALFPPFLVPSVILTFRGPPIGYNFWNEYFGSGTR
jgi:hypothetical protein